MVHTLAKSANNDIFLICGQLAMAEGKASYAVAIDSAIKTQRGELQLDVFNGIPFFESVFQSPSMLGLWKANVAERVEKFDFVESIEEFEAEIDFKNHVLKFTLEVLTDLGYVRVNDINFNISTIRPGGNSGEEENMASLIQDGIFYLPVFKEGSIQIYRQLKQNVSEEMGVTTELSEELYIKNGQGTFVVKSN